MRGALLALAIALLAAAGARAAPELSTPDEDRLAGLHDTAGRALLDLMARGSVEDVAVVAEALRGERSEEIDPEGEWDCRVVKLGVADGPVVAQPPFECRITAQDDGTWRFEKLTGAEKMTGTLFERSEGIVYAGVVHADDVAATPYEELPDDLDPSALPGLAPQVGLFEQTDADAARLMLPLPHVESTFDVIALTR